MLKPGRRQAEELKQWKNVWRATVQSKQGREVLYRIVEHCGLFSQSSALDAQTLALEKGKRAVAFWIIREMETAMPGASMTMQIEKQERLRVFESLTMTEVNNGG